MAVTLRLWFLTGCQPEVVLSSLPRGPLKSQPGRESPCKMVVAILCNLIMEANSITPAVFYWLELSQTPCPLSRGGGHLRVCPPYASTEEWTHKAWMSHNGIPYSRENEQILPHATRWVNLQTQQGVKGARQQRVMMKQEGRGQGTTFKRMTKPFRT